MWIYSSNKTGTNDATGSKPQVSLFALPRELRDEIYSYVFLDERVKILTKGRTTHNSGLIMANKQTHAETIKHFYRDSTFYTGSLRNLFMWLHLTPEHRRHLITKICCYREFFTSDVYMLSRGWDWGIPEWQPLDWDSVGDHEDTLLAYILGYLNDPVNLATGTRRIALQPGVLMLESKDMKLQRLREADRRAAEAIPEPQNRMVHQLRRLARIHLDFVISDWPWYLLAICVGVGAPLGAEKIWKLFRS